MAESFDILQTLNEYKGTWGTESGGKTVTVVAETMEAAASVLNEEGEGTDPIIIQCVKSQIKVSMPAIFVSFITEAVDSSGIAQTACQAYPGQYTLKAGSKQIFTAIPGDGFEFVKWQIDGEDAYNDQGTQATNAVEVLVIPSSATVITISAVFSASA